MKTNNFKSTLKLFLLFIFVLVPIFLSLAFYFIAGRIFDTPHYNALTSQWQNYTPQTTANPWEENAEKAIILLNDGLTDEEELQLIEYFNAAKNENKINEWLQYLKNKKFQDRNALELFILRFDEAIYNRPISAAFLWKATIATTTGLISRPSKQPRNNENQLLTLLTVICVDSTLSPDNFNDILKYNAHAWAWHNNRDSKLYEFTETYNIEENCLTQRTLIMLLPELLARSNQVGTATFQRIYDLLEKPQCRTNRRLANYDSEREKIKSILEKR